MSQPELFAPAEWPRFNPVNKKPVEGFLMLQHFHLYAWSRRLKGPEPQILLHIEAQTFGHQNRPAFYEPKDVYDEFRQVVDVPERTLMYHLARMEKKLGIIRRQRPEAGSNRGGFQVVREKYDATPLEPRQPRKARKCKTRATTLAAPEPVAAMRMASAEGRTEGDDSCNILHESEIPQTAAAPAPRQDLHDGSAPQSVAVGERTPAVAVAAIVGALQVVNERLHLGMPPFASGDAARCTWGRACPLFTEEEEKHVSQSVIPPEPDRPTDRPSSPSQKNPEKPRTAPTDEEIAAAIPEGLCTKVRQTLTPRLISWIRTGLQGAPVSELTEAIVEPNTWARFTSLGMLAWDTGTSIEGIAADVGRAWAKKQAAQRQKELRRAEEEAQARAELADFEDMPEPAPLEKCPRCHLVALDPVTKVCRSALCLKRTAK